ncbi:glycosyl transferase family 2 [Breznakibacter xylanolyticus]|uniref:Glycosyl transferase family 2 n=1 Tax=Breznakibacter xylanolyticus TaxID=990 RepID=A0A2W7NS49_9BACT|nr:glycosyltransferase family 2 protein [Breznakibacter xylanolyticus]PZX19444.1 glycosyl transferase family 2 [Breznakibacter xylanolyticus]
MTQPVISIITIVYNGAATLEKTIQSVAALHYKGIEYIVVDGGSRDGTLDIIRRHEASITRWISEPDRGLYDAMNKGIDLATGDYLWFINSGDEPASPDVIERMLTACPNADVYYGDTMMIDDNGQALGKRRLTPPAKLTWRDFRNGMRVSHQSFICKKTLAPYYNLQYHFSADYEWCLLVLKKSQHICNTQLVLSHFLDGGLTKKNIVPGLKERFRIMRQHFGLLPTIATHIPLGINLIGYILRHKRF